MLIAPNSLSSDSLANAAPFSLLEELLAIGTALSATSDLATLLDLILTKSRQITSSDAGSIFLVDRYSATPCLWFKAAQNSSCPALPLTEFTLPLSPDSLVGYVALTGESLNLPDAYDLPLQVSYRFDPSVDQQLNYRTRSVLVLPMLNTAGTVVGVLQLINRKVESTAIVTSENTSMVTQPYSLEEERIIRSLASQAAISIERNDLQTQIENLFAGFVTAAVQAIESRDPTTAGHSERVAELTVRLGEEVNEVSAGPLRGFQFDSHQLKEIRYAALLHDFGKVGVPEAVLNKRKKLHPGQLDEIRKRFDLARRTAEMDCCLDKYQYLLEHAHAPHEPPSQAPTQFQRWEQLLEEKLRQLELYWQLLLQANEPTLLTEAPLRQVESLSQYMYRGGDGQEHPLITPAELEQLLVHRGNLTPTERQMIEAHVTHTYEFLKRIPWTEELQQVPLIAYCHHEQLDGNGYPRKLKGAEIPFQAQIIAIADIYDALTASDRPYKKNVAVPRALEILHQEASVGKINGELVRLFEQRQIYRVLGHSI
uniref:Metal dependent phosphohydrolase n=1 Tax=Cyanothece sp. (strain PCC 7425 / ATCC 29141) TaxID=395961 RepID=B8HP69_CYAP4